MRRYLFALLFLTGCPAATQVPLATPSPILVGGKLISNDGGGLISPNGGTVAQPVNTGIISTNGSGFDATHAATDTPGGATTTMNPAASPSSAPTPAASPSPSPSPATTPAASR
ncbi:MAG: hypothetical protein JWM80_889 [Cyanobacteria bacterium RYN_339]|nr:hypothetical protein [Cyanobacteria bacterium RYN_339]